MFGVLYSVLLPFFTEDGWIDAKVFLRAGSGDLTGFYHSPWILLLYTPLSYLPLTWGIALAGLSNALGYVYALSVFQGNKIIFFTSYIFLSTVFYGQFEGVIAAGLALMLSQAKRNNAFLVSLGWFIACSKLYLGIPLGLGIWLLFLDRPRQWRTVGWMCVWTLLSFVIWGNWLANLLTQVRAVQVDTGLAYPSWDLIGGIALFLWIPVFFFCRKDLRLWFAAYFLTTPYLQHSSFTLFFLLPLGGIGLLGLVPFVFVVLHPYYLLLIPLRWYIASLWNEIQLRCFDGSRFVR